MMVYEHGPMPSQPGTPFTNVARSVGENA